MLTGKGNQALRIMFDSFRTNYLIYNPGASENDCERRFLYALMSRLEFDKSIDRNHLYDLIGTIS